jgi:hypothetical protein
VKEDRELEPGMRRTLFIVLILCAVGFAGFTILVRHFQKVPTVTPIPRYPGARQERYYLIEQTGYQKLVFQAESDYPAKKVYEYYQGVLAEQGFIQMPQDDRPSWQLSKVTSDENTYMLQASWVDSKRLHSFVLILQAKEKVIRDQETGRFVSRDTIPGIEVICTLSRNVIF